MNINYYLSPYPALTQNMVARAYEVDVNGGTSQVDEITIPERDGAGVPTPGAGHQVPFHVFFAGLDDVTHEIRLYTAGGTLLHKYDKTPVKDIVTLFQPIRFRIGDGNPDTPVAGTNLYTNAALAGVGPDEYIAIRTGYGPVIEGIHIGNQPGGGFLLLQDGDVFSGDPAEEWTIIMNPQTVTNYTNDSVVGKQWGPTAGNANIYVDVVASTDCATTHLRKIIRLAGTNAEYRFTNTYIPPMGYPFRITNMGTYTPGDPAPKVKFMNAALKWGNTTLAEIEVPLYSTYEFVWDGVQWNATMYNIPADTIPPAGQIIASGRYVMGDVGEGTGTIVHGLNLSFPYRVFGVIYSRNPNHLKDNTVTFCVHDFTNNQFKFSVQEIFGEVQLCDFDWIIVKI